MANIKGRPVFLELTRIRMPVNAVVSILHRISGLLLFVALPFVIYLLSLSVRDEQGYAEVQALFGSTTDKLLSVLMKWALTHHVLAGLRKQQNEHKVGVERETFKRNAW